MVARPQPVAPRFWPHVDRRDADSCWPWTGSATLKGYGILSVNGRPDGAHRVSWELHHGRPVPVGLHVCHHCDNPPCVNPAHLFVGTPGDNMRDKSRKGRNPGNQTDRGRKPFAIRGADLATAQAMVRDGLTQRSVAAHFGVSPAAVCRALKASQHFLTTHT